MPDQHRILDQAEVAEEPHNQVLMVKVILLHQLWEMVEMEQQQVLMVHLQLLLEEVALVAVVVFLQVEKVELAVVEMEQVNQHQLVLKQALLIQAAVVELEAVVPLPSHPEP